MKLKSYLSKTADLLLLVKVQITLWATRKFSLSSLVSHRFMENLISSLALAFLQGSIMAGCDALAGLSRSALRLERTSSGPLVPGLLGKELLGSVQSEGLPSAAMWIYLK